ncbi:MAG: DMT family transporter [Anaerovoracaceae bacterium]|nr:DMT family transporter [Bacillota bacterium]MDY3954022.1 DMT family transporter [Anaerovoracaceae bacterium]
MSYLKQKNKAILQMVICASLWSIAGIFIKLIPWNPMAIAGWRSFFSLLTVAVFLWKWHMPVRITKRSFFNGTLMCAVFFCFVAANKLTTAANAIVLQFTSPVFILLISALFLHQKFRKADVVAVLCTLGGISFFFFDQLKPGYLLGNCVAIFAGFLMGSMFLATGAAKDDERMGGMLLGHFFTAMVGIPFTFITDAPVTGTAVISVVILGVFQLGIPYILFALAVKYCPPLACSLIGAIEPLLNPVWVFLFDGEAPGMFALFGAVIVIVTVTAWCMWKDKHPVESAGSVEETSQYRGR